MNSGNHQHLNYHRPVIVSTRSAPLLSGLEVDLQRRFEKDGIHDAFVVMEPVIKDFSNGETLVHISRSVRDADVYILAQPRNEKHIIHSDIWEAKMLVRSCLVGQAHKVNLLLPCMPYARQDRSTRDREFPSFVLACEELVNAGVDTVTTFELHNDATVGYMRKQLSNHSTLNWMAKRISERLISDFSGQCHLIAPDTGSAKYIEKLRTELSNERHGHTNLSYSIVQKDRDPQTGKTSVIGVSTPAGVDLKGTRCIMVDDMIDTGGTAAQASRYLYERYGVAEVILVATHGIFSEGAAHKLGAGNFKKVCVTDTCPLPAHMNDFPGLTVWSVDKFLGGLVYNIHNGKSNVEFAKHAGHEE